jgi:glycosyltransferase involved in cell wall biosynthesis
MISFIVPAYNEEAWVGRCICAIHIAMESIGQLHEVIIVDDSSTDGTVSVAEQNGARVIRVKHRQISATRNAGARQASGEVLFFVDADTLINASVIQSALRHIGAGAVGGGCILQFDGWLPLWWRMLYPLMVIEVRLRRLPGGACLFCTRAAFETTGGFSEEHYAAEEALFNSALKRQGRFVVLADPVVTSGRNLRSHSFVSIVRLITRFALRGPDGFRDRSGLELWYHPKREEIQCLPPGGLTTPPQRTRR